MYKNNSILCFSMSLSFYKLDACKMKKGVKLKIEIV